MGMVKVKRLGEGKVKIIHQLNNDGTPYAEDIVIEAQKGAPAGRLSYLEKQDGKVGTFSFGFTPFEGDHSALKWPEDDETERR